MLALVGCATSAPQLTGDPRVDVDSHVLLAELAREREAFVESADHYLAAAMISEDPRYAGLATEMSHRLDLDDVGLQAARRWYELEPDNFRSSQFLGLFLLRTGDLEAAVEIHEALLLRSRNTAAGIALIIEALWDEEDDAPVIELVRRLVASNPDVAEGHYGLARLALRADDYGLAVSSARRSVELRADWTDAQLLLARVLVLTGRAEEGIALIGPIAAESDSLEVRLQFAELLLSAGRGDEARERLDEILIDNPGMPEAIRALAFLTLTRDELDDARGYFEQLRTQPRFRDEAFFYLGRIAENQEQPLQAMRSYSRVTTGSNAIEAQLRAANVLFTQLDDAEGALQHLREFGLGNPEFEIEMLVAQSDLLLRMARYEDAGQLVDAALDNHPDHPMLDQARLQIFVVRAQAAVANGELDLADDILRDGLRAHPGDTSLRYAQALLYQEQGDLRRAAAALESLVEDMPDDASLLNALGYLLTDSLDRHDEAYGYIEQALMLDPDNAAIIDSMGWVLFHLGDHAAALEQLLRAYELFPDPEVAAHIVDVRWALGEHAQARKLLETQLGEHPGDPYLEDVKQRLGL
jgi:tetratricopeptide (TPR) repeat protein